MKKPLILTLILAAPLIYVLIILYRDVQPKIPQHKFIKISLSKHNETLCSNGSPAFFYLKQGSGKNKDKWIINLQGEGQKFEQEGVFNADPSLNKDFYDFSMAIIPYCSNDYWLGESQSFNGNKIFKSAIEELYVFYNFKQADIIMLVGSKEGGIGATHLVNWLGSRFSEEVAIKLVLDNSWNDHSLGSKTREKYEIPQVEIASKETLNAWNAQIDKQCHREYGRNLTKCLGEDIIPFIKYPIFVYTDLANNSIKNYAEAIKDSLSNISGKFLTSIGATEGYINKDEIYDLKMIFDGREITYYVALSEWFFSENK